MNFHFKEYSPMYKKKNINMKHIPKIKNKIKLASDLELGSVNGLEIETLPEIMTSIIMGHLRQRNCLLTPINNSEEFLKHFVDLG